jgi:hypothetical protein
LSRTCKRKQKNNVYLNVDREKISNIGKERKKERQEKSERRREEGK